MLLKTCNGSVVHAPTLYPSDGRMGYHVVLSLLPLYRTVVQAPRDQLVSEALARVMERFRLSADDFILLKVRVYRLGHPLASAHGYMHAL